MAFLESDNLLLRALEPNDLDMLYKWENDSDLWKYGSTISPYSKFALRDYLENSLHGIYQTRQLRLMIVEKIFSGDAIGTIDIYDFDPFNQRAGIGILLDENHRNKGLGPEALALSGEYAFRFLLLKQLYAYIPVSNIPSFKIFSRCGYIESGILKSWIKTHERFEDVYFMQLINE